jgi:hypothetical protein
MSQYAAEYLNTVSSLLRRVHPDTGAGSSGCEYRLRRPSFLP